MNKKAKKLIIGDQVILNILELYAGREPLDVPQFIVTGGDGQRTLISDAARTFLVDTKYLSKI